MNERTLKPIIDAVTPLFPMLGASLAGPIGGIVGDLVAHVFGAQGQDPKVIAEKIVSDPDAKIKLATINYSHEEALSTLAYHMAVADNTDVQNARDREIEQLKVTGKRESFLPIFATLITLGFFAVIMFMTIVKVDPASQPILYTLLGVLGAAFGQATSYYCGSSHKSG
jgi:uncharacterized membrane protein YeaQ/YmgE (transglycosylase-associated protein family)